MIDLDKNMLISIFPYNSTEYLNNIAFDPKKNRGIESSIFLNLRKYLNSRNIEICTYDTYKEKPKYRIVYFDLPYPWNLKAWKIIILNRKKNILICNESSLIVPFNYWKIFHIFFTKVYCWYDGFEKNQKYKKILLPKSSIGINTEPVNYKNKNFLVFINKNILPFYPFKLLNLFGTELYSERIKAVNYFEKNIPGEFSLYGRGWNQPKKRNLTEKLFGYKKYKTYKGPVEDKIKTLSNFKYSICFENLTNVNGYVTEKIFDCLKARCVPVYLGADDITKYIPKNCFIDFRDFKNFEDLLKYLKSIDEKTYNIYIRNIDSLLNDKKFIEKWFEDGFSKFFTEEILEIK